MSLFPEPFRKRLIETFTDKDHSAYGQIATIDQSGRPQVRTVHIRYLDDLQVMAFGTNVESPKWHQLEKNRFLSGCYFDDHRQIQFRWESPITLIKATTRNKEEKNLVERMWRLIRLPIRISYWIDHKKGSLKDIPTLLSNDPAPTFGVVVCHPTLWDFHEVMLGNLLKSRRHIFRLQNNEWKCQKASTLHGKRM